MPERYCTAIALEDCQGDIVTAHLRMGLAGGMGLKPPDKWSFDLCWGHHSLQHTIGEKRFWLMVLESDPAALRDALRAFAEKRYEAHDD